MYHVIGAASQTSESLSTSGAWIIAILLAILICDPFNWFTKKTKKRRKKRRRKSH